MALVIKGSSSGQITLDVPSASGTNTLVIPAESGNILTNDTTGTIVQVISATDSGNRTRASTSFGTLTLNAAITPVNSSNKILCLFSGVIEVTDGGRAQLCLSRAISGGATTELLGGSASLMREQDTSNHNVGAHFTFVDSPSTTSATTYTLHGKTENGNTLTLVGGGAISTLTLLEVVA